MFKYRPERELHETEPPVEKLKKFLEDAAEKLKAEGIPVNADSRIDMRAFGGKLYSEEEIRADAQTVENARQKWYPSLSQEQIAEENIKTDGEQLEMLKTAAFYKNLSSDFIVVRSSGFDDIKNGVDNILVDKRTGNVVCAFDEVSDTSGQVYEKKRSAVVNRNIKEGGAVVKYSLGIGKDKKIEPAKLDNVPIFYLSLSKGYLTKALANFQDSEKQSDFEKKLFAYFVAAINMQTKDLELHGKKLNQQLQKRLGDFGRVVESMTI